MPACAARVQKIMEYASSDIRFDVPLAEACFEDRQEFCASVPPGSARVIRCLQDRCGAVQEVPWLAFHPTRFLPVSMHGQ